MLHWTQVLAYFTAIVSCVTLFGVMTIPDIIRESADFVTRLQSDSIWVVVLEKIRHGLGYSSLPPALPIACISFTLSSCVLEKVLVPYCSHICYALKGAALSTSSPAGP